MATTFSPSATAWIIQRWQTEPGSVMIRTLNRTSGSLEQLLDTANAENVDLILTSSPMLLQHLQEHQKLALLDSAPAASQKLVPRSIRSTSVAVAVSGFGLLINRSALAARHLPPPADWQDMGLPSYQGALLMSSPSRSDTNHLMVESLLQQKGWTAGWATLLAISGNLVTISSRSFGVADKIKSGLGVAGPVIDNYANLLLNDPNLAFTYFPYSAVSPTYVAVLKNSRHADEARAFIHYLLSPKGQRILADANTGKYPVAPLSADNPRAAQQQRLMAQPPLNYRLILKRQQLVQRMFDTAISFRLAQLKDAWRALHSAETRLKHPLPEIRALLTSVPVDAASSEDETWLAQFENIRALDDWPSTITLRQTIDELLEIGMVKNKMPDTMRDYVAAQKALLDASRAREATLGRFRTLLEAQLGSSHQQMQTFNQRLEQIVRVSGGLILVATLLALLLAWGLNHYFIRSRLVKRFTALNQAVVQIGLGRTDSTIPVYGRDELGRIARLLRHTLGQLNMQRRQLEQEVAERKEIEADLRAMQDELIQTAKLAVVGQTMTTLAHEINQPLNALSMYLFTAGRAIEQGQSGQARNTLTKAEGLINRIDAIIRSLRQFTRRAELETPLYPVDLRQTFVAAWELLAMRHQSRQGALSLPTDTVWVSGDEVRIQQVLVNVLANALDACSHDAAIAVTWQTQGEALEVYIADNGPGWPVALLPSLLKPFTTSKAVGLGIGLSISVSLMAQMKGDLRLASTLTRNACVVLQFSVTDVDDVE